MALSFSSVATATNNWMGQMDLTPLPRGGWVTLSFPVPPEMTAVLLGDTPGAQLIVTTNTGTVGLLVAGLRFAGALQTRTVRHTVGSERIDVATSPLWSFEHPGDWSSPASRFLDASHVSDGQASLAVEASGWTSITSRSFSTTEIPQATNRLGVDVLVPSPEVNPWWTGEIRIHATCPAAGIHNEFLGNKPLSHLFLGEFNHVTFDLPPAAGAAFSAPGTCQLEIILNVVNDAGAFRLDRLGFE